MNSPATAAITGFTTPMSRRSALRVFGVAGIAVASANFLAACTPAPAVSATGGPAVAGGVLSLGLNGGNPGTVLDPHRLTEGFDAFFGWMFYEQVARLDGGFNAYNVLAEELVPNADGTQWVLRLKDGIEFHNGKTVDADDVIFSFNRVLDPATAGTAAGSLATIAEMTKLDARTVQFDMFAPHGWFDLALADTGAMGIVPVGFDVTKPVSTGPFKFVSHNPGVDAVLERFENYHGTAPLLDGLKLISLPDDDARTNAILSKQIDSVIALPPTQVSRLQADSNFVVQTMESGGFTVITMRTDSGPTADPRVRQALRLAADREQYSQVLAGGFSTPASDLYGVFDPESPTDLVRTRDVAAAKKLISDAGAEGLTFTMTVPETESPLAQVFVKNAAEIGVTVDVEVKDVNSYFSQGYLEYDVAIDYFPSSLQLTYASLADGPNSFINETHFSDKEYNAEFELANAGLTPEERMPHMRRMQEILFERGGYLIPMFPNSISATTSNVGGWPTENKSGFQVAYGIGGIGFINPAAP